ncbi:outer membrane lipoprotein carrier protein LolA [Pleionea sediminis]|uniref:outer membrane lipoprotein carrier protein LolA n=1 Tax=Pleionea sediminis TaxID=2569479 RepID=UPI001184A5BB|nr:outer membrane lipoprotein carrier protein LolA [Pleionea sediminis]
MIKHFFILLLIIPSMVTLADENTDATILDKVYQCVEIKDKVSGEFTQTKHLSILKKPLIINGEYVLLDNGDLEWSQVKPIKVTYFIEADNIYRLNDNNEKEEQRSFNQGAASSMLTTLKASMTGNFDLLLDNFELQVREVDCKWTIFLTSKNDDLKSFLKSIVLKGTSQVDEVSILEVNGDKTTIELNQSSSKRMLLNAR